MRDRDGVRWLTIMEAVEETRMSRPTIMAWIKIGVPSMMVWGKRWVREPELFARLRDTLAENPRAKTRWQNRQRD